MSHTFFLLDPTINPSLFQKKDLPKSEKTVSHLLMSGWFFLLGSYLLAKNWNYRPVQLKQARFIGQAVCSPGVRADQQAQELPCSILASLFYIPCSLPWVVTRAYANRALFLRPIREGDANTVYTQDLSGKGAYCACCPTESLHLDQCFLFYFFFFLQFMV